MTFAGGLLASAGDDKVIIIWEQIEDGEDIQRAFGEDDETNDDKENWRPRVILR